MRPSVFAIMLSILSSSAPLFAETKIEPPDVFVHVALVRAELDLIRLELGKPKDKQPELPVSEAAPREVYFQAQTLFRKADRFCFEILRRRDTLPHEPGGTIAPVHVFGVVNAVLKKIRDIKKALNIPEKVTAPKRNKEHTPTNVLRSIVQANRQLNLLLEHRFTPSDVFQRVTQAVAYASVLLSQFPGAKRIPNAPDFERKKRPADVYRRLVAVYQLIRQIGQKSNVKMLKLEVENGGLDLVAPSDVYDVASLLVSELAHLHQLSATSKQPLQSYYPGRKTPSHVYQRAGILQRQLENLLKLVQKNPNWLKQKSKTP